MSFITFSWILTYIYIQASGNLNYDPSFVTEALRENEHSDNSNQDSNLLKDVAVQAYLG